MNVIVMEIYIKLAAIKEFFLIFNFIHHIKIRCWLFFCSTQNYVDENNKNKSHEVKNTISKYENQ